jgi:hypothetical protein
VAEPGRDQIRNIETAGGFHDVVEGVGTRIPETLRIGKRPDPEGIEDDDEDPALRTPAGVHL